LSDWDVAEHLLRENPRLIEPDGVLHLMAKRNDLAAAKWLLAHGADPNGRWAHWDADVTPLHLAILGDHPEMVGVLLAAGADPRIRDSQHDSDAFGWAEFFGRTAILDVLKTSGS
jgi:ankyrin repeat protein